ncbi:MAG: hypothetical protein HZB20_04065 [Chloroflexi bacterium]|nr:hypothetical protein [Chloroflexota bacterium]
MLLALVGAGLYAVGALKANRRGSHWQTYGGAGTAVFLLAVGVGVFAMLPGWARTTASPVVANAAQLPTLLLPAAQPASVAVAAPTSTEEPEPAPPTYPTPTPPVVLPADTGVQSPQAAPDTSSVMRIVIPSQGVDAVVKYVPFDGLTWNMTGLRQEVARLGDT